MEASEEAIESPAILEHRVIGRFRAVEVTYKYMILRPRAQQKAKGIV